MMLTQRRPIYKKCLPVLFILLVVGLSVVVFSSPSKKQNIKQQTFKLISKVREDKKQEVIGYFQSIKRQAHAIDRDQQMRHFFTRMADGQANPALEYEIDKHYVSSYGNFYDILFVDATGYIFHSIRKEADYQKNIFTSDNFATSKLSKSLQAPRGESFVEYEFYPPSNEAAAFFTVPLVEDGQPLGWFILQCETNRVNTILTDRRGLGRTGEVYLVNTESLMLSESRFMGDSTILQQKVDTTAVREALALRKGEKIIHDYRGVKVFSSFEKFDLFGVSWVIIVEIDEDEVITEYFKKNRRYLIKEIVAYLETKEPQNQPQLSLVGLEEMRVDMNEFAKAKPNSYLSTKGVATCTAIAISYPGKFGYLAHISPTDEIYIDSFVTEYVLQGDYHSFLSDLLAKIKYYEIYPSELQQLQFTIIAPHNESFAKAVEVILSHDLELANIIFLYNPKARSANVVMLPPHYDTYVLWDESVLAAGSSAQDETLGDIVKMIIGYDLPVG